MAQKTINLGTGELTGDGETLRSAFSKANDNFTELYNNDAADFDGAFGSLTGKPTTIAGYGITDSFDGAFGSLTGKPNLFSTVASSGQNDIVADGTSDKLYIEAGAGIGITTDENTDTLTITATGGSGLSNVVEDTSPQLGGNLDMNGFEIVTTAGGHIRLDPDTTGGVGIGNVTNPSTLLHLQQSAPIITLQRLDNALSQGISWTGQAGTEAAHIKLDGTGGTTNTLIMSAFDGASVTERLRIMAASGAGIQVTGTLNGHTIPGGAGTLALTSDITGISNVVQDTTPQLGGDLDVNGKTIAHTFVLGANGSSDYTFSDAGNIWFPTTENDPVLYLRRGEQYIFTNKSGGANPFKIRVSNGGSAYSTGVTNNGASSGNIIFKVPMSAPATLYYQCTSHSGMGNTINIV